MATECLFSDSCSITLNFGSFTINAAPTPSTGFTEVANSLTLIPSQAILSQCNPGNDGQTLLGSTLCPNADFSHQVKITDQYNQTQTAFLFDTSYKGLYYAIHIQSAKCDDIYGYFPPSSSETALADPGDDRDKACMDYANWTFWSRLYIGPQFVQPAAAVGFSSSVSPHGTFRISGATGDKDNRTVKVTTVSMSGTLKP
jgi:hypothetical protein